MEEEQSAEDAQAADKSDFFDARPRGLYNRGSPAAMPVNVPQPFLHFDIWETQLEALTRAERSDITDDPVPAALIRRIVGGDESAMTGLYDATKRLLFGLIVRIVSDRSAAEEVLLDVYSHVWRRAEDYDPAAGEAIPWLMGIARARAIDRLRAAKPDTARTEAEEMLSADPSSQEGGPEFAVITARRRLVCSALESLPLEERQVIEMAYYHGLSHGEVAAGLGLPLAMVKMRARLGMIKLSDLLRPLFDGRA